MKLRKLFLGLMVAILVGVAVPESLGQVQTAQAKEKYTIKYFPKRLRGTWYTYDKLSHKYDRIKITATKMSENGYVTKLKARKYSDYPKVGDKIHPHLITGTNFTFTYKHTREKWTNIKGWNQTAGAGSYYRYVTHKTNGKKHAFLQLAGGASINTDNYGLHSKRLAKLYSNRHFKGDRHY